MNVKGEQTKHGHLYEKFERDARGNEYRKFMKEENTGFGRMKVRSHVGNISKMK